MAHEEEDKYDGAIWSALKYFKMKRQLLAFEKKSLLKVEQGMEVLAPDH